MKYDVIVVGAGASGLTAAYRLKQADADLKILVLEANNRVGGRTLTSPIDIGNGKTEKFDLGGQWVAKSQTHVMTLIKELNLETYDQFITGTKFMQLGDNEIRTYQSDIPSMGSVLSLIELQFFLWKAERMCKLVPSTDPYSSPLAAELEGLTVDTWCRKYFWTAGAHEVVNVACGTVFGADSSRIDALFFLAYANAAGGIRNLLEVKNEAAQELRVKGGTQQISEKLAEKFGTENILLNYPVKLIRQTDDLVTLVAENGKTFHAGRVIITAPPNQLAKVIFEPALPSQKKLINENFPMGHLIKFIVTFKTPFWRDKKFSGEIVSNGGDSATAGVTMGPISVCYDATTDKGTAALVGFISSRAGIEWQPKSDEQRRNAVIKDLASFFGPEIHDYVSYTEKIWAQEPYVGGCPVAFGVPGIMFAFPHIRLPFERLHFGGTETATAWMGYISGAIQSGERAAHEVLQHIRPQLVSKKDLKGTAFDAACQPKQYVRKRYCAVNSNQIITWILGAIVAYLAVALGAKLWPFCHQ